MATMKILRTPDPCFDHLPGYDFAPNYLDVGEGESRVRVHYLDEGPRDGAICLLMHGEPSWSYLYRKMIPVLTAAGHRVLAPDLVGFGRSDKPTERSDYNYLRHVEWMRDVVVGLDLQAVTLMCQDWGGLIGLRLVAEHPQRFARVVAANTFLATGDQTMPEAFFQWQQLSQNLPVFATGRIINGGCTGNLSHEIMAAYDAPFPDESFKAGARQFPMLVPSRPDDPAASANRAAWKVLSEWRKPFLTAFSDGDPITAGAERILQERIPGARGQAHTTIEQAGHFLQEDQGPKLAEVICSFIAAT